MSFQEFKQKQIVVLIAFAISNFIGINNVVLVSKSMVKTKPNIIFCLSICKFILTKDSNLISMARLHNGNPWQMLQIRLDLCLIILNLSITIYLLTPTAI
jgi:hypothetical protein